MSHPNVLADRLSRLRDHDDWKLNPRIFREASAKWGVPQVNRFAIANNAQCERFNSRWGDPQSEARDAFTQVWRGTHGWLNPPWGCIGRVLLAKVRCEGGRGGVRRRAVLEQPILVPRAARELADDIVYYIRTGVRPVPAGPYQLRFGANWGQIRANGSLFEENGSKSHA
jgi:hypothetical protein